MCYPRAGKFGGYLEHWVYLRGFPRGYAIPQLALMWVLDSRDAPVSHSYPLPEKIFPYSGWMIYQPRGISSEGTPFDCFFWHRWGAALLLVGVAFHVVYDSFVARGANPMAVNRAQAKIILAVIKNFFGLSKSYPLATKYHTGQIIFHWAVAGNLFLLILTGFVIWKPFRDLLPLALFGLVWDFIYYNRLFHGFFSATLGASLIVHFYFALLIKKNWVETKSMITGRVPLREYLDSHSLLD